MHIVSKRPPACVRACVCRGVQAVGRAGGRLRQAAVCADHCCWRLQWNGLPRHMRLSAQKAPRCRALQGPAGSLYGFYEGCCPVARLPPATVVVQPHSGCMGACGGTCSRSPPAIPLRLLLLDPLGPCRDPMWPRQCCSVALPAAVGGRARGAAGLHACIAQRRPPPRFGLEPFFQFYS
jgi:hypothetical protein